MDNFIPFLGKIAAFVLFAIGVEAALRVLFLIKRRILPVAETKVEDDIERTINKKMKIEVEQIEKKHEKLENNLEEKIKKTEEKVNKKMDKEIKKSKDIEENKNNNN